MMTDQTLVLPAQLTGQVPMTTHAVIIIQVNPGETFTIRAEDGSLQCIQGPAEVPMMSLNGSIPPIHVPPGYISQVVEDSVGIRHVVITPHAECYPTPPLSITLPHSFLPYVPPPHFLPVCHPLLYLPPGVGDVHTPHPHPHWVLPPYAEEIMPLYPVAVCLGQDDHPTKLQPKVRERRLASPSLKGPTVAAVKSPGVTRAKRPDSLDRGVDAQSLSDSLLGIDKPQVLDVQALSARLGWKPPAGSGERPCWYQVELSGQVRDGEHCAVYSGENCECVLGDLRPATEYYARLIAVCGSMRRSSSVIFTTLSSVPDCPLPPRLSHRTKSSLTLQWKSPADNGSEITQYLLEWNEGKDSGPFRQCYSGIQTHCRLARLCPSVGYTFRLAALNDFGTSAFSPEVVFYTTGPVLPLPQPPRLVGTGVTWVSVEWSRPESLPPEEVLTYTLEGREESSGASFEPKYTGDRLAYIVEGLRGSTQYGFRLIILSARGRIGPGPVLLCSTSTDLPGPTSKLHLKGAVTAQGFTVTWDLPQSPSGPECLTSLLEISEADSDGSAWQVVYSGTATEYTCGGLRPDAQYRLRLRNSISSGHSQPTESLLVRTLSMLPGPCLPPRIVGKARHREVHLCWECPPAEGAGRAREFSLEMKSADGESAAVYRGPDLDCTVTSLLSGASYWFRVRGANEAGYGPFSEATEVTTAFGPPGQCEAPLLTLTSDTCILVSWKGLDECAADISEYRLEWRQDEDSPEVVYSGMDLWYEMADLALGSQYFCRVQAVNQEGAGSYSEPASCWTPRAPPGVVPGFTLLERDPAFPPSTCLALTWERPFCNGAPITGYTVSLGDHLVAVGDVSFHVVEGLQPDTEYSLRIRAVNELGPGPFCAPLRSRTQPLPPAPPTLECATASPQSLKLRWADGVGCKVPPTDSVTYDLQMEDSNQRFVNIYRGSSHTFKVQRLTEGSCYSFRVRALGPAGEGLFSDTRTFSTSRSVPPAPKAPRTLQLNDSTWQITWESIPPIRGDPIIYVLQVQVGRESEYKQVFKGPETSFHMGVLSSSAEQRFRVAACRRCMGSGLELSGPFGPPCLFRPQSAKPAHVAPSSTLSTGHSSDEQFAALIVATLTAVSVLVAFVLQFLFMK